MLLSIVCATLLYQEPQITFSAPAQAIETLCPNLGQKLGLKLSVDPKLAKEILLVQVASVSQKELLGQIAAATGGRWENTNGDLRLTLLQSDERNLQKVEMKDRADAIRYQIDWFQSRWERITVAEFREALQSGQIKRPSKDGSTFLASLGEETLGGLLPGQRIVLTARPNAYQLGLTPAQVTVLNAVEIGDKEYARTGRKLEKFRFAVLKAPVQVAQPIGRIYAVGHKGDILSVGGFGQPGKYERPHAIQGKFIQDQPLAVDPFLISLQDAVKTADDLVSPEMWIQSLNAGDVLYYRLKDLVRPVDPVLSKRLSDIDKDEPLDWSVGAPLRQVASAENSNLVAYLPDSVLAPSLRAVAKPLVTTRDYVQALVESGVVTIEKSDRWLFVRPRRPITARRARLNRSVLARTFTHLSQSGDLDLNQQIEASIQPIVALDENFEFLFTSIIGLSHGEKMALSVINGERPLLRIIQGLGGTALLGRAKREWALNLTPASTKREIDSFLFGSLSTWSSPDDWIEMDTAFIEHVDQERTFYWLRAPSNPFRIALHVETEPCILGLTPSGIMPNMSTEVHGTRGSVDDPEGNFATSLPRLDAYTKGRRRKITLFLRGNGEDFKVGTVNEIKPVQGSPIMPFEDLPEELRDSITEANKSSQPSRDPVVPRTEVQAKSAAQNPRLTRSESL